MSPSPRIGLLVMAYGTATDPSEVMEYYTHIRHGHAPSQEVVDELAGRYAQLPGGRSPLLEITTDQMNAIADAVRAQGVDLAAVELGQKHSAPFIEDGVAALIEAGVDRIIGIVLAPHWSTMSVAEYLGRARRTAAELKPELSLDLVADWHLAGGYIDWLTAAVQRALLQIPAEHRAGTEVLFTAHSLPVRILQENDPYPVSLKETAAAVAEQAGIDLWSTGWQSAGQTATPWLGPDLLEILPAKKAEGRSGVVVCACGFVSDHLEVLYDLDIETKGAAGELGLAFARTDMPNDDAPFIATLAGVVLEAIAQPPGPSAAEQAAADKHATHTGKPEHAGRPGARGTLTEEQPAPQA
ncbi:MAG: ferrochelatase [Patulibacter sp.]|nr:ferrochelatase [Patulibacter sp.]